jgi:hypothetical protein
MLKSDCFPVPPQPAYNLRNRTIMVPNLSEIRTLLLTRRNISGVVDLSEYVNLQRLIINGTDVEDIICFPQTLKILWCSGTKITKLHHLPDSLIFIQCDNKMYFDRLPNSLHTLYITGCRDTTTNQLNKPNELYINDYGINVLFKTKYHDRFIEESNYILK